MTSTFRRFFAAALAACGFSLPAAATTIGTDFTDLWYNPAEPGWGINFIHQYNTLFATMFVYEADRAPHWFVASEMNGSGNAYAGTLYQTTGPAYNAVWTGVSPPASVGGISVNFTSASTATLQYSANGATVTKQIQRQSFRSNNIAGLYYGGFSAQTNCSPPKALAQGEMTVTHSNFQTGGTVRIDLIFLDGGTPPVVRSCVFSGTYSAQGRLGSLSGASSCIGVPGTFVMSEIEASRNGFSSAFTMSDQSGCTFNGHFGGTRDLR